MKPSRLVLLAAAGACSFVFSGCSPVGDVAIEANGTTLSNDDVDLFTSFLCNYRAEAGADPNAGGEAPAVPLQQARTEAARLLAESLVLGKAADAADAPEDLAAVEQSLTQLTALIDSSASGKDRERLKELLVDSISSSTRIETTVKNQMVTELGDAINQLPQEEGQAIFDQKYAELLASSLKAADLEIDPVYGIDAATLTPGQDPSLSLPVSQYAKDATSAQPGAEWLAALPQNLRCG